MTNRPPHSRLARIGRAAILGVAVATAASVVSVAGPADAAAPAAPRSGAAHGPRTPDLGPNVVILDPSMPTAEIKAKLDAINAQQIDAEMGTTRYAVLFKPGTYG